MWKLKYNITGKKYEKLWGDSSIDMIETLKETFKKLAMCEYVYAYEKDITTGQVSDLKYMRLIKYTYIV